MIGGVKENTTLHLLYGQKKAAGRAVDKDMEDDRRGQGEYNITSTVRTEEGGWESRGQRYGR